MRKSNRNRVAPMAVRITEAGLGGGAAVEADLADPRLFEIDYKSSFAVADKITAAVEHKDLDFVFAILDSYHEHTKHTKTEGFRFAILSAIADIAGLDNPDLEPVEKGQPSVNWVKGENYARLLVECEKYGFGKERIDGAIEHYYNQENFVPLKVERSFVERFCCCGSSQQPALGR